MGKSVSFCKIFVNVCNIVFPGSFTKGNSILSNFFAYNSLLSEIEMNRILTEIIWNFYEYHSFG